LPIRTCRRPAGVPLRQRFVEHPAPLFEIGIMA